MVNQCWSQAVLESDSWGHSVLQTPALVFSKGHNSGKGHNPDKKKTNMCQLFFHEESIHEISKP